MKYIVSLTLFIAGILLSFNVSNAEIPFYKEIIHNWSTSLLLTHLLPGLLISLSILTILLKKIKNTIYLIISFSILMLIDFASSNIFQFGILELILILIILVFSILTLKNKNENQVFIKNSALRVILISIFSITSFITPYLISPIAQYALIDHPTENIQTSYIDLLNKYVDLDSIKQKSTVIALFSTNCPFCFEAAEKIGVTQGFKNFKNVITIFPSKEEDANLFIENSFYETTKILCTKEDFIKLTDGRYPKFFIIDENKKVSRYGASSFQHRTIDLLSNLN